MHKVFMPCAWQYSYTIAFLVISIARQLQLYYIFYIHIASHTLHQCEEATLMQVCVCVGSIITQTRLSRMMPSCFIARNCQTIVQHFRVLQSTSYMAMYVSSYISYHACMYIAIAIYTYVLWMVELQRVRQYYYVQKQHFKYIAIPSPAVGLSHCLVYDGH